MYENVPTWTDVPNKSNGSIQNWTASGHVAPEPVLLSASTSVNASRMDISWSSDSSMSVGVDPKFFLLLYFAELEATQELRQFDVSVDNDPLATAFSPKFLVATVLSRIVQGSSNHTVSLVATSNSTLQPLISAMEIYMVRPVNEFTTDSLDGMCSYGGQIGKKLLNFSMLKPSAIYQCLNLILDYTSSFSLWNSLIFILNDKLVMLTTLHA
jgi:hypothetical protein